MLHTHTLSALHQGPRFWPLYSKLVTSLWLCVLFFAPSISMAAGPDYLSLQSFAALKEQGQLILYTPINIEPREAMRHILRDGAQVLLTCTAKLERKRSILPSSTVATSTAAMTLNYDPLSRQYILAAALPEDFENNEDFKDSKNFTIKETLKASETKENTRPEQDRHREDNLTIKPKSIQPSFGHRDFNTLMDSTLGRLRIPLCSTSLFQADKDYFVTIRVTLRHTKVPPWLSQTLFFWSWDVVPSIEFSQDIRNDEGGD